MTLWPALVLSSATSRSSYIPPIQIYGRQHPGHLVIFHLHASQLLHSKDFYTSGSLGSVLRSTQARITDFDRMNSSHCGYLWILIIPQWTYSFGAGSLSMLSFTDQLQTASFTVDLSLAQFRMTWRCVVTPHSMYAGFWNHISSIHDYGSMQVIKLLENPHFILLLRSSFHPYQ